MELVLESIKKAIEPKLEPLNIVVDEIVYEKEGNYYFLRITLDRESGLDLDTVVEATNIINPILDEADLVKEKYILEVYGKSKGSDKNDER